MTDVLHPAPEAWDAWSTGDFSTNGHQRPQGGPSAWAPLTIFGEKGAFLPAAAGSNLLTSGLYVAKGGEQLYTYHGGGYVPGDSRIKELLARDLGADHWRPNRADAVLQYLSAVAPDLWERPPLDRINLANGIFNLCTGQLEPHTPEFLSPIQLQVSYDPDALCPAIDRFIAQVFPVDSVQLAYAIAGWLMFPDTAYQKAILLIGIGRNGKSVYLLLLQALVGATNCSARSLQALSDHFAAADLYGKLANIAADIPGARVEDVSTFKSIVGADPLTGERKYRDAFKFEPYARLIFSGQEIPPAPDSSDAYIDRWIIVRFPHRFGPDPRTGGLVCPACGVVHARIPNVIDSLTTPDELSGFLNKALAAYRRVKERGGFSQTATTKRGTEELEDTVDPTSAFIAERCYIEDRAEARKPLLYKGYVEWCADSGRKAMSTRRFYPLMLRRGFEEDRRHGVDWIHGIGLLEEPKE